MKICEGGVKVKTRSTNPYNLFHQWFQIINKVFCFDLNVFIMYLYYIIFDVAFCILVCRTSENVLSMSN